MTDLATIASVAPLLGLLITVEGIVSSFVGCGGEKWTCLAAVVDRLANSVARSALGLAVGLLASLGYRYLQGRLCTLRFEMDDMTATLVNILAARAARTDAGPRS